jgi:hypothetical protein
MVRLMIWHNKHLISNRNFNIIRKPMCIYVQNLSLSALGAETGLTGNTISLTDVPDIQIGLTDTSTGLTGPADPSNSVLENLASNGPEQDKTDIIDWRRPIIDYL